MYNGVGVPTTRGTGTNGFVQKNLSHINKSFSTMAYIDRDKNKKMVISTEKEVNSEILEHEKKRKMELKCVELEMRLEDEGVDPVDIKKQVDALRKKLFDDYNYEMNRTVIVEGKEVNAREYEAKKALDDKNRRMRDAFGLNNSRQRANFGGVSNEAKMYEAIARSTTRGDFESQGVMPAGNNHPDRVSTRPSKSSNTDSRVYRYDTSKRYDDSSPNYSSDNSIEKEQSKKLKIKQSKNRNYSSQSSEDERDRKSRHQPSPQAEVDNRKRKTRKPSSSPKIRSKRVDRSSSDDIRDRRTRHDSSDDVRDRRTRHDSSDDERVSRKKSQKHSSSSVETDKKRVKAVVAASSDEEIDRKEQRDRSHKSRGKELEVKDINRKVDLNSRDRSFKDDYVKKSRDRSDSGDDRLRNRSKRSTRTRRERSDSNSEQSNERSKRSTRQTRSNKK